MALTTYEIRYIGSGCADGGDLAAGPFPSLDDAEEWWARNVTGTSLRRLLDHVLVRRSGEKTSLLVADPTRFL